jgi:formate dehydrogenase maturation protein FdhE
MNNVRTNGGMLWYIKVDIYWLARVNKVPKISHKIKEKRVEMYCPACENPPPRFTPQKPKNEQPRS